MKLYSINDRKLESFTPPFIARNDVDARRQVAAFLASSPDVLPAKYPEDFSLFCVGEWDDSKGVITPFLDFLGCLTAMAPKPQIEE